MPFNIKRSGAWQAPAAGTVNIKSGGKWIPVDRVRYSDGTQWADSGFIGRPGPVTEAACTSTGNGDNRTVTFSWKAPAAGQATPEGYRIQLFNSSFVLMSVGWAAYNATPGYTTSYSITFSPYIGDTVYVRILSYKGSAYPLTGNPVFKVVMGAPTISTPIYGWSSTEKWATPTVDAVSSTLSPTYAGVNVTDNDDSTAWISASHVNSSTANEWEWMQLRLNGHNNDPVGGKYPKVRTLRALLSTGAANRVYVSVTDDLIWYGDYYITEANNLPAYMTGAYSPYISRYSPTEGVPYPQETIGNLPWLRASLGDREMFGASPKSRIILGPPFTNESLPYPQSTGTTPESSPYAARIVDVQYSYLEVVQQGTSVTPPTSNTVTVESNFPSI